MTQAVRSDNTLHSNFARLRTVFMWCIHRGITTNNPFLQFEMPKAVYGTPWYISIEERDCLYELDLSDNPHLATFRDMFVFQCFLGCRFGDLLNLKKENVIDGVWSIFRRRPRITTEEPSVFLLQRKLSLSMTDTKTDRPFRCFHTTTWQTSTRLSVRSWNWHILTGKCRYSTLRPDRTRCDRYTKLPLPMLPEELSSEISTSKCKTRI